MPRVIVNEGEPVVVLEFPKTGAAAANMAFRRKFNGKFEEVNSVNYVKYFVKAADFIKAMK